MDDDVMEVAAGVLALAEAHPDYDLAEEYYCGTRPEFFADARMRALLEQTGVSYKINFAKTPVNVRVDRMEIATVRAATEANNDVIDVIRKANGLGLEEKEVHQKACEFGDAYVMVWPSDLDDPENPEKLLIALHDPRTVRVVYDADGPNPRKPLYAIKYWKTGDLYRATMYYDDLITRWVTKAKDSDPKKAESWMPFVEADEFGELVDPEQPNPYGRIPFFHFRTARPYGIPVHKEAYGPQDIINKIVISHMTTMDYAAAPQRYALSGNDVDDEEQDAEEFAFTEEEEGLIRDRHESPRSTLRSSPGTMWLLKNVKGVGQFDPAAPNVFLDPLATYIRIMAQTANTPMHYFDPAGSMPSGESLRVAENPLVKDVKHLHALMGAVWQDLYEFALRVLNIEDTVTIAWVPPIDREDQAAWDLAETKRSMGIPERVIFSELGYSEDAMDEWGVPDVAGGYEQPQPYATEPNTIPKRITIPT